MPAACNRGKYSQTFTKYQNRDHGRQIGTGFPNNNGGKIKTLLWCGALKMPFKTPVFKWDCLRK